METWDVSLLHRAHGLFQGLIEMEKQLREAITCMLAMLLITFWLNGFSKIKKLQEVKVD